MKSSTACSSSGLRTKPVPRIPCGKRATSPRAWCWASFKPRASRSAKSLRGNVHPGMETRSSVPPADLLPVQRQATPMFRFLKLTVVPLLHLLFRIKVDGREHIPKDRTYVLIANHLNWLDSLAILATFPAEPRVHFMGDTTILITRKVQWALVKSVAGFIPVNRKARPDTALFDHVNRCLQRGGVVALYPEGNYGPAEGEIMPFK